MAGTNAMKALRAKTEMATFAESTNLALFLRVFILCPFIVPLMLFQLGKKRALDIQNILLNRRVLRFNPKPLHDLIERQAIREHQHHILFERVQTVVELPLNAIFNGLQAHRMLDHLVIILTSRPFHIHRKLKQMAYTTFTREDIIYSAFCRSVKSVGIARCISKLHQGDWASRIKRTRRFIFLRANKSSLLRCLTLTQSRKE